MNACNDSIHPSRSTKQWPVKALHTADQEQTHGLPQVQAMIDSICQQEGSVQVMDLSCLAAIEIQWKATRLERQQIGSEDVGSV